MPELPEVETVKNALSKAICGANITAATVLCDKFREKIPADFASKVTGAKIINCQRIAKYIVISLNIADFSLSSIENANLILYYKCN